MVSILGAIIVSTTMGATQLQLGEQTSMEVRITHDATEEVVLPPFAAVLPWNMSAVDTLKPDTTVLEDGRIQIDRKATVADFNDCKDTTFLVEPFVLRENGDTVYAPAVEVSVKCPEGIAEMKDVEDIKAIENVPIWWWDVAKWGVLGIGVALLGIGIYFLVIWLLIKYRPKADPVDPILLRPADEVALEKLDEIKAEKKWQAGKVKEYHTELTDVVREYIGRRFEVRSAEKTSDETLRAMRPLIDKDLFGKLSHMLQLADMVKFAKWTTTPDENETALLTAYEFVNETKIIDDLTIDD